MVSNASRPIIRAKIADLKPHPRQANYFPTSTPAAIMVLVEDMETRGQQHPIEILPDNTIVCGHDRVAAAKVLGWTEVDAVVRDDLAKLADNAVEEHVIRDNFLRKQLSPLARARCAKRLREIELERRRTATAASRKKRLQGRVRDEIAKLLQLKGREVDRLLRVLETPREVQEAYDQGRLSLVTAGRVAGLCQATQRKIAEAIRGGAAPRQAVTSHLPQAKATRVDVQPAVRRLLTDLARGHRVLAGRIAEWSVDQRRKAVDLQNVRKGLKLLHELEVQILRDPRENQIALPAEGDLGDNGCSGGPP